MKIPDDKLVTLNYTYFGDETLLERKGAWVDVNMHIDHSGDPPDIGISPDCTDYKIDLTIFVVKGTSVDSGLDGTLSICVTPSSGDWLKVSLMA